ncbi:DUF1697 domain-containing protein [Streptomyces sp. NPDC051561]|uniref:DUF1697 domain-containing protein n=1 Tax=Streptomyces sp. NPDC051561 TaxID=3365658 RepID=UPI0037B8F2CB
MKTKRYAALLRGVNVGGAKVPMAELRGLLAELGHTDITTYLNSGNAVFGADAGIPQDDLARDLETAIEKHFGFPVACLVRDHTYLRAVADGCPFPADALEGKQLHATYYSGPLGPDRFAGIDTQAYLPEEFRLGDKVLYLYAPGGLGRSKLAEALAKPALNKGLIPTSRNWNTVRKLVELTAP